MLLYEVAKVWLAKSIVESSDIAALLDVSAVLMTDGARSGLLFGQLCSVMGVGARWSRCIHPKRLQRLAFSSGNSSEDFSCHTVSTGYHSTKDQDSWLKAIKS